MNGYTLRRNLRYFAMHLFLMSVAVTCLFPLFYMIRCSVMDNQTIFTDKGLLPSVVNIGNYATAWIDGNFGTFFFNSLLYTTSVVIGIVVISSMAAYAFSRLHFPGRDWFYYMFVIAMMIPLPGSFVPLFVLMNTLQLTNTKIGYILCMINVGLSLSIILLKTFFDKMPSDLEDAARIDGCSKWQIWWNVALPLARPAVAVIVIFNALNVWNEFILAQLLLSDPQHMPLQVGLMKFINVHTVNYPIMMAGLTIAAVPIILLYLAMQKHIIKGLSSGAVVG